jgi:drug/metabolite transporter (DMT)-like permease
VLNSLPVIACVFSISVGQILFKLAAAQIDTSSTRALVSTLVFNLPLVAALLLYAATTVAWVWLLKERPLGAVYPLFALSFVFVAVLSRIFLGETIGLPVIAGTILIVSGVLLITAYR